MSLVFGPFFFETHGQFPLKGEIIQGTKGQSLHGKNFSFMTFSCLQLDCDHLNNLH